MLEGVPIDFGGVSTPNFMSFITDKSNPELLLVGVIKSLIIFGLGVELGGMLWTWQCA